MRRHEFERASARWLQAIALGLVLALGCAATGCKSEKAAAETEDEASEGEDDKPAPSKKKAKAKREAEEDHETGKPKAAEQTASEAKGEESKAEEKGAAQAADHHAPEPPMSAEQALARLKAGNAAFLEGAIHIAHLTEERRSSLAAGQHPFAIILSCSDSRVPPEQVFAQGLGDLFTIRVAGNIADPATVASIEYAAAHLGSPLLVVMGHTECGAVKAALAGAHDTPSITKLVKAIRPALEEMPQGADLERAVRANVSQARADVLRQSQLLNELVREQRLKVAEAVYHLKTGQVKFIK